MTGGTSQMVATAKKPTRKTSSSERHALTEKLEAGIASLQAGRVVSKPEYDRMVKEILRKGSAKGTRAAR